VELAGEHFALFLLLDPQAKLKPFAPPFGSE
jgi:hypothetical protein